MISSLPVAGITFESQCISTTAWKMLRLFSARCVATSRYLYARGWLCGQRAKDSSRSEIMPSRETQALILKVALELFNEHRSASVSTNRIAEACEISKGNLNYHFRTKQDIILALFADITVEMNRAWYEDHRNPTMEHMAFMFVRQLRLIWRYRFFYREIIPLLRE